MYKMSNPKQKSYFSIYRSFHSSRLAKPICALSLPLIFISSGQLFEPISPAFTTAHAPEKSMEEGKYPGNENRQYTGGCGCARNFVDLIVSPEIDERRLQAHCVSRNRQNDRIELPVPSGETLLTREFAFYWPVGATQRKDILCERNSTSVATFELFIVQPHSSQVTGPRILLNVHSEFGHP